MKIRLKRQAQRVTVPIIINFSKVEIGAVPTTIDQKKQKVRTVNAQRDIFLNRCALCVALCAAFAGQLGNAFAAQEIVKKDPQRIVSINLCTDELLLQLVGPERVAALTKFSADPEFSTIAGKAQDIKKIQGGIEDVQACGPDLLIGGKFNNKATLHFFERSGIPVMTFALPKNFEDIFADIRRLAAAVGAQEKGEAIIRGMQEELATLNPSVKPDQFPELSGKTIPGIGRVQAGMRAIFFQSGGLVPGSGTFENAIMEAAGFENLAAVSGIKDYGNLSLEQLIRMKPDILIFASDQKKRPTVRGEMLDHPAIKKALPHVKSVTIPSAILNCGSPASVEAVRILIKAKGDSLLEARNS